ncbi:MAG: hypothetical protein WC301_05775 [Candidatus Omnitrophota bacterium]|jgi:hypothetical protein
MKKLAEGIISERKAQALTELAIFGSILLFCLAMLIQFGLQANYQQEAQMEAFRKAQQMAFNRDGPNSAVSLTLFKNKAIPDPRDQFGFAERVAIPGSGSVTWDTDQSAAYIKKFDDAPQEEDLPAMYFQMEGVSRGDVVLDQDNYPTGERIQDVAKAEVVSGDKNTFGFYTAKFEKRPCPPKIIVVFEDREHSQNTEYIKEPVFKDQIMVSRLEGGFEGIEAETGSTLLMYPYFRRSGSLIKQRITDADLDGDGRLEYILAADKNKNLFYIRYHGASPADAYDKVGNIQVDTAYAQIDPGDREVTEYGLGRELTPQDRQGLLRDFEKSIQHSGSKIVRTENAGSVESETTLNAKQTTYYKFRLNDGRTVSIPVELSTDPGTALYKWAN